MRVTKRGGSVAPYDPRVNPWVLVVLFLFTALSSGCQLLQNEFWTY